VESLKVASGNNAVTVGITNYMKSPIGEYSKYLLCTSFYESSVRAAALSSRVAQLCLLDALYLLTARYKEKLWDIADLNDLTEKLLRYGD
jgi:DNA-binding MurR/RpiR family transcriptional regulator